MVQVRYQLYIVSCTGGFYPALNSSPPTEVRADVEKLDEIIQKLRPGHGRHYTTVVVRSETDGSLNQDDVDFMQREASILIGFYR